MRQILFVTLTGLVVGYQNFTYVDWGSVKLVPINEKNRGKHAKELLGSHFEKSSKTRGSRLKLHQKMHSLVKENLAEKHLDRSLEISRAIITESQKHKLDPFFVIAVIKTESKFDPEALGGHGEIGLMQIKPDTAEWIVDKLSLEVPQTFRLMDPVTNIRIGTAYMSYLRKKFPHKPQRYIAAYNMGPSNVRKLTARNLTPREYPDKVLGNYRLIYQQVNNRTQRPIAEPKGL